VAGDSHARGCAEKLIPHLKQHVQVYAYVKPGANTTAITNSISAGKIKQLRTV
jgi:hypothetical protein